MYVCMYAAETFIIMTRALTEIRTGYLLSQNYKEFYDVGD
jgi:hypothetical protein